MFFGSHEETHLARPFTEVTMTRFELRVIGAARVENKMRKAAAASENVPKLTHAWAVDTVAKIRRKRNPPRRRGQTYRRTGRLKRGWKVEKGAKSSVIVNTANRGGRQYAMYVVGDQRGNRQAWMHRGRWWVARDEIEKEIPELRDEILDEIGV